MSQLWDLLLQLMVNGLIYLYQFLGHNFALSIAILTIVVRLITLPFTLPQQRSAQETAQKMQKIKPQLDALQKKYGRDRERLYREQQKLYKEHGIDPFAGMKGCLPLLIQWPIIIAFYQAISKVLADNPLGLLSLSKHISPGLAPLVPLESHFLWLNLARPDPFYILPVLVTVTTWMSQKMMTPPTTDPQTASMNQSMQLTMPLLFGFITMQWASGLAIYFVVTNVVGMVIQYFVSGWGGLLPQKAEVSPVKAADDRGKKPSKKRKK